MAPTQNITQGMDHAIIIEAFLIVIIGGLGNIWGALLGATLVGTLQKGIEWYNPSNTLAAA